MIPIRVDIKNTYAMTQLLDRTFVTLKKYIIVDMVDNKYTLTGWKINFPKAL